MRYLSAIFLLVSITFSDVAAAILDFSSADSHISLDLAAESESESESELEVELKKETKLHNSFLIFLDIDIQDINKQTLRADTYKHSSPLREIPSPPPDLF